MKRLSPRAAYHGLIKLYRDQRPDLTEYQVKQLAYAMSYEPSERLGGSREYHVACRTCGESKVFRAADSVRLFLGRHAGHRTWLDVLR